MKSTYNRGSFYLSTLFNCTVILLFAIFATSALRPQPSITANLKVPLFGCSGRNCYLRFEPNIDLTSQFNFNTKQIFLYLLCKTSKRTEMCWSKLILKGDSYRLFSKESYNYMFSSDGDDSPTFELRGNIYPYVGKLKDVGYGELRYERNK